MADKSMELMDELLEAIKSGIEDGDIKVVMLDSDDCDCCDECESQESDGDIIIDSLCLRMVEDNEACFHILNGWCANHRAYLAAREQKNEKYEQCAIGAMVSLEKVFFETMVSMHSKIIDLVFGDFEGDLGEHVIDVIRTRFVREYLASEGD